MVRYTAQARNDVDDTLYYPTVPTYSTVGVAGVEKLRLCRNDRRWSHACIHPGVGCTTRNPVQHHRRGRERVRVQGGEQAPTTKRVCYIPGGHQGTGAA